MNLKITPNKAKTYHITINHNAKTNRKKPLLFNEVMAVVKAHQVTANLNTGTGIIELSSATKEILYELKNLGIKYSKKSGVI